MKEIQAGLEVVSPTLKTGGRSLYSTLMSEPAGGNVNWQEWSEAAFDRARAEHKPVLLGISAVWCHWCHVMDRTTYADDGIARIINERFVPVRVDNDLRPDINRRFNQGGWPTTAFLTADGDLIAGATYLPADQMRRVLDQVAEAYARDPDGLRRRAAAQRARRTPGLPAAHGETLGWHVVNHARDVALAEFDAEQGGFGREPKFPQPETLRLLAGEFARTRELTCAEALALTLENMGERGMYDQVEGGFYRYSTDREWKTPHFEKMCEDNAALVSIYVEGARLLDRPDLADKARHALGWVERVLTDPAGGFRGSQDADEEYYAIPDPRERAARTAPYIDPRIYTEWSSAMAVTHLQAAAALPAPDLAGRGLQALDRLLAEGLTPAGAAVRVLGAAEPGFAADQAGAIFALTIAHRHTGRAPYLDAARRIAEWSLANLHDAAEGTFADRPPGSGEGALATRQAPAEDNAAFARAFIALADETGEKRHLDTARGALAAFLGGYRRLGLFASGLACATASLLSEPADVVVAASDAEAGRALERIALARPHERIRLRRLVAGRDDNALREGGYEPGVAAQAYVCRGTTCLPPVCEPAELAALLDGRAA
jgi:uncharacterized protein YyaL (SSP411 family)